MVWLVNGKENCSGTYCIVLHVNLNVASALSLDILLVLCSEKMKDVFDRMHSTTTRHAGEMGTIYLLAGVRFWRWWHGRVVFHRQDHMFPIHLWLMVGIRG